jgi:alkanesulfonate monooxygenase SsuD/methylene tetrahydromethanopterin reductase-like flavin-dependent oxidoreductase (luciferase family)
MPRSAQTVTPASQQGEPVRFGATIIQVVPFEVLSDDFVFAESIGLDNAWVIDQFGIDEAPEVPLLEAWTTLAAVARETRRIRLGAMVTNVAMRNPGVLAQSILTVDQISGGRVEAALGGGFYPVEHAALGIDFPAGPSRSERLKEGVEILDRALRGDSVTYTGSHFRLAEATFRPLPTQRPRPPLWVAGQATRSLRVAVQHADALVSLGSEAQAMDVSLPAYRERMQRVDELCRDVGRDPVTLRRCLFAGWANEPIFASVDATHDYVGRYVEAGATDFTFYLYNPAEALLEELVKQHRMATRDQLARVAEEVFPAYRITS